MSLLCRLKNLVHKGILKEKDLERIVIIPKGQEPCDCISRAEALKNLALTNGKDDVYRMINGLQSVYPKTDVLDKIRNEIADIYCSQYCENPYTAATVRKMALEIIDKYMTEKE